MTTYTVHVEHVPSAPFDPIPWSYAVLDGETVLWSGWAGTEAEAREYAQEWIDGDGAAWRA